MEKRKNSNNDRTSGSCTPTDRDAAKQSSAGAFTLSQKDVNPDMDKKEDDTTFNLDGVLSVTRQKKINISDVENELKHTELPRQPENKSPWSPSSLRQDSDRAYDRGALDRANQVSSMLIK